MNSIATHVEYLLRKHDCVVLPGMGAFICNYVPAHFDVSDSQMLNPPGRALVFNCDLRESDGLLISSMARKERIAYDAAARMVADEVEQIQRQIAASGEFAFGRLGIFTRGDEGQPVFEPGHLPSVNGYFYGLRPVAAIPVEVRAAAAAPYAAAVAEAAVQSAGRQHNWRVYASGIAAILAVAITLSLFIIRPIKVSAPPETASIAPVPEELIADENPSEAIEPVVLPAPTTPEATALTQSENTEEPVVETVAEKNILTSTEKTVQPAQPAAPVRRFNDSDPYCVIVASFPTLAQAQQYLSQHGSDELGILEKDNKFRIYSATASSYNAAVGQKSLIGQSDAWICRR